MLTLTREESEQDGLVEHDHGERGLGGASVMAWRRRTQTVASLEIGWWHRQFGEVEEMMAELWARCSGQWLRWWQRASVAELGGNGDDARFRSSTVRVGARVRQRE